MEKKDFIFYLYLIFIFTEEESSMPLIGNNVIDEATKEDARDESKRSDVIDMLESSIESIDRKTAEALVNLIESKVVVDQPESLGNVNIGGKDVVPKGRNLKLKCICRCGPVSSDTPVLFQPNLNLDLSNSRLVIGEGVVVLERGKTVNCLIPVSNPTGSDIVCGKL